MVKRMDKWMDGWMNRWMEGKWGSVISMNLKMEEREENKRMMYEM